MGRVIINPGGAGGIDPDELTVTPEKVLAGEIFGGAGSDEPQTGTMDVQSILSFSAAVYSSTAVTFTWKNPLRGPFSGVIIVGKAGSYPTGITDGTRYYKGYGNNPAANGVSSMVVDGFSGGVTYYFRAFSYALRNGVEWISGKTYTATASTTKGQRTFTSSGMFTVPAGVRLIDVFCVGGGASGTNGTSGASDTCAGGGGGSGRTATVKAVSVTPGQQFAVNIGAGGANDTTWSGNGGGATSFGELCVAVGGGGRPSVSGGTTGGSGGGSSGGGSAYSSNRRGIGGAGGSNGSSGGVGASAITAGAGQGTTTRAFGEAAETLYAGGGAGGSYSSGSTYSAAGGGAGGGGRGGYRVSSSSSSDISPGQPGTPGTGGGGGGGTNYSSASSAYAWCRQGGAGGSGICIVHWGY